MTASPFAPDDDEHMRGERSAPGTNSLGPLGMSGLPDVRPLPFHANPTLMAGLKFRHRE